PGSVQGLLGTDSGNPANDLALPDGTVLPQPVSQSTLYGQYADAWRITDQTSLFDYAPGQSTATFTNEDFPVVLGPTITADPVSGLAGTPIKLNLDVQPVSRPGDPTSVTSILIGNIPVGATLS